MSEWVGAPFFRILRTEEGTVSLRSACDSDRGRTQRRDGEGSGVSGDSSPCWRSKHDSEPVRGRIHKIRSASALLQFDSVTEISIAYLDLATERLDLLNQLQEICLREDLGLHVEIENDKRTQRIEYRLLNSDREETLEAWQKDLRIHTDQKKSADIV